MATRENRAGRGLTGRTGARGERGEIGKTGLTGPVGPAGVSPSRADVLVMVEDQFVEIRKELGLQLARMGQIPGAARSNPRIDQETAPRLKKSGGMHYQGVSGIEREGPDYPTSAGVIVQRPGASTLGAGWIARRSSR